MRRDQGVNKYGKGNVQGTKGNDWIWQRGDKGNNWTVRKNTVNIFVINLTQFVHF